MISDLLAAAACLAVLAAGCASHGAAPLPGSSTTAAPSAAASTPATTAPVTTAPAGQASAPRCHTTQLLTNHSGTTCHVYGYPGLAFFGNVPMATHLTWVKEPHASVVLRPGGNAQALLTWRANTATGPAPFQSRHRAHHSAR